VSDTGTGGRRGPLARLRARLSHDQGLTEAAELMADSREAGATPLVECCLGQRVRVQGTVRSVIVRPRGHVQAYEAELYDGSGRLTVLWLGRRRIRGVDPGRMIVLTGRVTELDGRAAMFNPRYELLPGPGA
jgi:RecG-like helicase